MVQVCSTYLHISCNVKSTTLLLLATTDGMIISSFESAYPPNHVIIVCDNPGLAMQDHKENRGKLHDLNPHGVPVFIKISLPA
jgi:hypothetical protein